MLWVISGDFKETFGGFGRLKMFLQFGICSSATSKGKMKRKQERLLAIFYKTQKNRKINWVICSTWFEFPIAVLAGDILLHYWIEGLLLFFVKKAVISTNNT